MSRFIVQPHTVARTGPAQAHRLTMPKVGPFGAGPSLSGGSSGTTPDQLFSANNWYKWWNGPLGYTFGQGDAFGGGTEQGTDFGTPLNTPIHSNISGQVVYSGYSGDPSLGYVIQIVDAAGGVWHFQHMNSSSVRVGQTLAAGALLGNSGGPPGKYSSGPHIEVRYSPTFNPALAIGTGVGGAFWNDGKWINPLPVIQTSVGAPLGAAPPGGTSGGMISGLINSLLGFQNSSTAALPLSASFQLPKVQLSPTGDVTNFLIAMDTAVEVVNPFYVLNAQQDSILGATFTDPISWIEGFGFNLIADLVAVIWRAILVIAGMYLLFKVSNHWINYQALSATVGKGIMLGGAGA